MEREYSSKLRIQPRQLEVIVRHDHKEHSEDILQPQTWLRDEERLRSILLDVSEVIVVTDRLGSINAIVPSVRNLIPGDDASLLGTSLVGYLGEDSQSILAEILAGEILGSQSSTFKWRVKGDNGALIDVECVVNDLRSDEAVDGLIFTLRDITERTQLELQLRQSQKLEAVGRLSGGIVHEINTPIQFINDNVRFLTDAFEYLLLTLDKYKELALDESQQSDVAAEIESIETSSDFAFLRGEILPAFEETQAGIDRVAGIVSSMKAFGYVDKREQAAADINKSLANTLVVANSEIKHIATVECDFGLIPPVVCYIGELNQVWLNLLVNAVHAIEDAKRSLGVITVRTRLDGDDVVVEIADSGSGIPDDVAPHIFDVFFSTKEIGRGTGQGLAISRQSIVERHNGSISFETKRGVGTTFTVRIPVAGTLIEGNSTSRP